MTDDTNDPEDRGDDLPADDLESDAAPEPEAPQPKPEAPQPESEPRIPLARFNEVNEKLREERHARLEMEARLRALETPKIPAFDAVAAERDYLDAVAEGDKDKARDLWTKIRDHERRQDEARLTERVQAELDRHRQQTALETVAETLTEKYPFLDPHHETADAKAIAEVVEWRDYYHVAKKMPLHQALKEAVKRVAPAYVKTPATTLASGADRTLAQRQANAKASAQLPPSTGHAGIGERAARAIKVDVGKMSDAEFEALPAAERAKLRGDIAA